MKTPQEKKRLSYAKDRPKLYGEHDKGSRKSITDNKMYQRRTERCIQNSALGLIPSSLSPDDLTAAENLVKKQNPTAVVQISKSAFR